MAAQQAPTSASPVGSQSSTNEDISRDATESAPSSQNTSYEPTECLQIDLQAEIEILAAYIVKEKAPSLVLTAINRVRDAYMKRVKQKDTEQAIRQLQTAV